MSDSLPLLTYLPPPNHEPGRNSDRRRSETASVPLVSSRSPLLPNRRPKPDLFVCDIFGAALTSDIASLDHPIFSLLTKRDLNIRRYRHGDVYVEVKPSADGLATLHNCDVLIYCISQLMAGVRNSVLLRRTSSKWGNQSLCFRLRPQHQDVDAAIVLAIET